MANLFERDKGVIVACDFPVLGKLDQVVMATMDLPAIVGYKVGALLALTFGLHEVVHQISAVLPRDHNKKIIYDHQKGGTDIPDMGVNFAKVIGGAGIDAAILFPFAGMKTQVAWTKAFHEVGLTVIVGAEMTHPGFLTSEGGVIAPTVGESIFKVAAEQGVTNFVVPGNKPDVIEMYRSIFDNRVGVGRYALYAPGLITQGGDISEAGKVAGDRWYAIVGRAIYDAVDTKDIREAAKKVVSQIS
ncbi:MAG: orotidine 5'-phosphate decarboxylase [Candidatus Pacebacteria bacterium]|nr:orotidine 5'-phosphate decarboxylase [Candidatus Paceibacterota bacterium]